MVGSGGREHALAEVLGRTAEVVVTPGNAMIAGSVPTPVEELVADGSVDLVVIGPEQPLVDGLADRLRATGVAVFGPGADGAQMEGSKAWMKDLVAAAALPTAGYGTFTEVEPALAYLRTLPGPYVVKTDGLAAGKGVLVTGSLVDAEADVRHKLAGASFGDAGRRVVIEEGLTGPEVSVFAICDGTRTVCLPPAQDFKRVGDGDTGPNTGGMGAYAPLPWAPTGLAGELAETVLTPTVDELARRGTPYAGLLYAGLALTATGPKVVEFNARFGDPETQVVLPLLDTPLAGLLLAAATGRLHEAGPLRWRDAAAVTVVVAAAGYPGPPRTGDPVEGLAEAAGVPGVQVLHAGTAQVDGRLVTQGGRVLSVTAVGKDLAAARDSAYDAVGRIRLTGAHHRTDIALHAVHGEVAVPGQEEGSWPSRALHG